MALYHCVKFHIFIFNTFRDKLRTILLLQKLEREITLKLLVIVMVLALCTSTIGRLSMYLLSFI